MVGEKTFFCIVTTQTDIYLGYVYTQTTLVHRIACTTSYYAINAMRLRERHRLIRGRVTSFCVSRGYTASSFPPMEIEQPLVMGRSSSGRISKVSNWQDFRALISFIEIIIRRRNLPNETKLAQNSNILCECEKTRRRRRRREIKRGEREREREREKKRVSRRRYGGISGRASFTREI